MNSNGFDDDQFRDPITPYSSGISDWAIFFGVNREFLRRKLREIKIMPDSKKGKKEIYDDLTGEGMLYLAVEDYKSRKSQSRAKISDVLVRLDEITNRLESLEKDMEIAKKIIKKFWTIKFNSGTNEL